jgi:hypothetical protein
LTSGAVRRLAGAVPGCGAAPGRRGARLWCGTWPARCLGLVVGLGGLLRFRVGAAGEDLPVCGFPG